MAICIACSGCSPSPSSGARASDSSLGFAPDELDAARANGRALFLEHCALCHGVHADGRGQRVTGFEIPPADLRRPEYRDAARVLHAVREGMQGTPMPAWKQRLDEREIRALSLFVVHLEEVPDVPGLRMR